MAGSGAQIDPEEPFFDDPERFIVDLEAALDRSPLDPVEVHRRLGNVRPEDIASVLLELDSDRKLRLFRVLSHDVAAQILDETDRVSKAELVEALGVDTLSQMLDTLPPDEAVDLLTLLEPQRRRGVLDRLEPEHAENLRELEKFDPETAGGLMTNEFLSGAPADRIGDLLDRVSESEGEIPDAYLYVVDELHNLLGVASIKQLWRADENDTVDQVMQKPYIAVPPDMDREEVARIVGRYHLAAIPVTDERGSLLGVVEADDLLDVLEEEATEDMYRLAGAGSHNPFAESVGRRLRSRLPWLAVTMLGGFSAVVIIDQFGERLQQMQQAAFFLPIIGALAGNVGVQASTIMVRGFATGQIVADGRSGVNIILREMSVGIAIGAICAIASGIFAAIYAGFYVDALVLRFAISVGLSIFLAVSVAAAVGTVVPLVCSRIGVDPALAAGPFIITLIDIFAYLIYLLVLTALFFQALAVS